MVGIQHSIFVDLFIVALYILLERLFDSKHVQRTKCCSHICTDCVSVL
jgi:hypothetical protein